MEISPFDAKIIEMLSRIDETEFRQEVQDNRIQAKPGVNYFRDLYVDRLLRTGMYREVGATNDGSVILKAVKSGAPEKVKITQDGKVNGQRIKEFLASLRPVEEADIPLPSAPSVGDMPEGPSNLVTGEMPMPDAATPPEDAPIEGEEEEEKETPEGIREYIDMIRRALTLDPNSLELSDFQKKALYTTVTAKNAEEKLKVYNKILNDYDPIEQPSEVPNYDPYSTKNS